MPAVAATVHVDVLQTRTGTFTNVTVVKITSKDIFIRHASGIGNVKIDDLDNEALVKLGLANPSSRPSGATNENPASGWVDIFSNPDDATRSSPVRFFNKESLPVSMSKLTSFSATSAWRLGVAVLLVGLALVLGMYLFYCYCLKLICIKAGHTPGFLIWLPVLQLFPALRAADMSPLWFIAFFVPVLNVVAVIVWCLKIVEARRKSVLVAILLILPVTDLFAFLYLAFSDSAKKEDAAKPSGVMRPLVLET